MHKTVLAASLAAIALAACSKAADQSANSTAALPATTADNAMGAPAPDNTADNAA